LSYGLQGLDPRADTPIATTLRKDIKDVHKTWPFCDNECRLQPVPDQFLRCISPQ